MLQKEKTQSTISSYNSEALLERIAIVPGKSASEIQTAMSDLLLPTTNTIEPQKAKREVKVPTRIGQYFTHGSVINEEKEPFSCKQALKSSSADKTLDAIRKEIQNLNENKTWSLDESPYNRESVPEKWAFRIKKSEHGVAEK